MAQTEKTRVRQFIEYESGTLLGTLRYYLFRAGLDGRDVSMDSAAQDLLHDVVAEALEHEDRFRVTGQPKAWLLGIAANLVKRRQHELVKLDHREPLIRDLHPEMEGQMSDDELFDWIAEAAAMTPDRIDQDDEIHELMASLAPDDERVLRLAILNGLDGAALANALQISAGAARVRLHRAIGRLRVAYYKRENDHA